MKAFQYKRGWLAEVEPGRPFRMTRGTEPREQTSRKKLREHGELHSPRWVAEKLGVNVETVYEWIHTGSKTTGRKLGSFPAGRRYRISDLHIEEFLGA